MTTHEVMRTLGHIARLVYADREIPEAILSQLLTNPGKALPKLIKPPQPAEVQQLCGDLPHDMPTNVSVEDQGGFWLTWYGQNSRHGGARPGAGRPAEVEGARRLNVMLDEQTIERAKTLGDGNLSAGLRIAVSRATR